MKKLYKIIRTCLHSTDVKITYKRLQKGVSPQATAYTSWWQNLIFYKRFYLDSDEPFEQEKTFSIINTFAYLESEIMNNEKAL